jgi:hypothetical protein
MENTEEKIEIDAGTILEGHTDAEVFVCKCCSTEQRKKKYSWNTARKDCIGTDKRRAALYCVSLEDGGCGNQLGIYSLDNPYVVADEKKK